ncbi:hypothetical protein [Paenibacillus endoradicis]|uniref:hypothetical protein n=1 Tax=Paenibacillus endoradicis TaxID=2972487 RepID=UPI002159776D|nr:hypothetical protein [Paenibacillus endoradicis]MCR8657096.1 hypothetical protein [Paenibacillus endoradicis]
MMKSLSLKCTLMLLSLGLISLCWLTTNTEAATKYMESKSINTQLEDKQSSNDKEERHSSHHKNMSKEELQAHKLKKMQMLANYFEIDTEGKSAKELRVAIEKAKIEQPEKWEMFKQQFRAKKLEEMREFAKSKGISIEGKTEQQLREELHKLKQSKKE